MDFLVPKVSVIIPTYKRETKYLSRAINSIINQTYKNIEIVVVDDNPSTTEFRKKVTEFMHHFNEDPRIIYKKNAKNVGGSLSRNNGINVATGEYVTFLDDDDEYLPEKIEKQVEFMRENNCDMSFTDLKLVNQDKKIIDFRSYLNLKDFNRDSLLKYHIMRHLTGTPTFMYKINKLKEIGGFEDAKMGQEFYLMLKTIERNLKIRYLNECDVLAYRHNDGGISQGKNKIEGEKALYNFKTKYLSKFNTREKMFIRFRHYAVMTVAYKRNKNYMYAILYFLKMIVASPIDFIKELKKFVTTISKNRRMENSIK